MTAEDHNIYGGLGGAVAEALAQTTPCPIEFVGVRDAFGQSGEPEELAEHLCTRIFLMNRVSEAREHLGLEPLPRFELHTKVDEAEDGGESE